MKLNFRKENFSKNDLKVMAVVNKLLKDPNTSYKLSDNIRYLENKEKDVILIVRDGFTIFANHKFYVQEAFPLKFTDKLTAMIKDKINKDLEKLQTEIVESKMDIYVNFYKDAIH